MPPRKGHIKLFQMALMIDWESKEKIEAYALKHNFRVGALLREFVLKALKEIEDERDN